MSSVLSHLQKNTFPYRVLSCTHKGGILDDLRRLVGLACILLFYGAINSNIKAVSSRWANTSRSEAYGRSALVYAVLFLGALQLYFHLEE